jgi:chlorite dismutase
MDTDREGHRRQFVSFSFYHVLPEWRRLPLEERERQRREFVETVHKWNVPDTMKVLTYSLVGTRADADMLLWRICYSVSCLQEMSSDLLRTRLGGYLETPYSYLGMTRRSQYSIGDAHTAQEQHGHIRPGGAKYLFVYPMSRTRSWYLLNFEDRQRMIAEVVHTGQEFPDMHLHVAYSFGLDDQDFVLALETDHPDLYVERVMRLRETESSLHVLSDIPMFTSMRVSPEEMLERIG